MASETVLVEPLHQGLVNVRAPSTLRPGELAALDDMIYRPNDVGPWRAPGRVAYGPVVSQVIVASAADTSTTLTSAGLFGTNIANVTTSTSSNQLTSAAAFGAVQVGQTVWGTGLPINTRVQRVIDSSTIQISAIPTASGVITATFSNLWAGMFLSNPNLPAGTTIVSITNASTLTMSQPAHPAIAAGNVTFSASVKGQRYIQYDPLPDPTNNFLIAYAGANYYSSVFSAEAGTFAQLLYAGDGPTLDIVHYGNRHFAFNGNTQGVPNQVIKGGTGTPVVRRHGLKPVKAAPSLQLVAGSWTVLPFGNTWYWYLTTEVAKYVPGKDEVESTFDATAAVIQVPDNAHAVQVTRNPQIPENPEATHWRVYRAGPTTGGDASYMPPLSSFFQVSDDIPINNPGITSIDTWIDSSVTTLSSAGFQNVSNVTNWNQAIKVTTGVGGGAQDAVGAFTTVNGATMRLDTPTLPVALGAAGWAGTNPPAGTTVGIIIGIVGRKVGFPDGISIGVRISWNAGVSWTAEQQVSLIAKSWTTFSIGGQNNTWGRVWNTANDFLPANLRVEVNCRTQQVPPYPAVTTLVDFVTINVYTSASTQFQNPTGLRQFPTVTVTVSPVTTVVGANGEPPIASTGDIFNGQLVTNDLADASLMRYSLPDGVDYFPSVYFLNFETKEADVITCIRRLADKLIVGLQYQLYAVNYLPRETDAEFDRGRAYEAISERHGIVGPQAACLFAPPGQPEMMAYVSQENIHQSDGFRTTTATEDIDWPNMVEISRINQCVLVDYPKLSSLVLFYTPKGGTENTRALWLSYHPSHIKEGGKLLVSGPIVVRAGSSHMARLNLDWIFLTGHNRDGKVYVEDRGAYDNSDLVTGINPHLLGREMWLGGVGYETTVERTWVHHSKAAPIMSILCQPYRHNTNSDRSAIPPPKGPKTLTTTIEGLSRLEQHFLCEIAQFEFTCPDAGAGLNSSWKLNFVAFEVAGHGLENSGAGNV